MSIIYRQYNADHLTPVLAYGIIKQYYTHSILCESVEKAAGRGRYSIIACHPDAIWECIASDQSTTTFYDENCNIINMITSSDPLWSLKALYQDTKCEIPDALPSACAGLFGYFSYDAIRLVEKIPQSPNDPLGLPDGSLFRPRIVIIFDSVYDTLYIVTNNFDGNSNEKDINNRLDDIENLLIKPTKPTILRQLPDLNQQVDLSQLHYHQSKESFIDTVKTIKEYIYAGDAFQIVPSQRFSMDFTQDYYDFYRVLRRINPSPYMFYFNHKDFVIAGASPEILVRNENGIVTIRPIAGTRPRGKNPAEDKALEQDLLNDEKEVAEHLMLLDLGRNDVGRISEYGTVQVTEEYTVEYYSHVMHIVSNVTGKLKAGYDYIDAFFSALPAGTVSGAPKIRAMEIINELEPEKRGFYAGGIGYFASNGNGDFSIMLRTALLKDQKIYIQAGAGIVADSDPESEYQETINKAKAVVKAAMIANQD